MADSAATATYVCDACNGSFTGQPVGYGLLVFPRGENVVREQPPLCANCALAIGVTAFARLAAEDEEG